MQEPRVTVRTQPLRIPVYPSGHLPISRYTSDRRCRLESGSGRSPTLSPCLEGHVTDDGKDGWLTSSLDRDGERQRGRVAVLVRVGRGQVIGYVPPAAKQACLPVNSTRTSKLMPIQELVSRNRPQGRPSEAVLCPVVPTGRCRFGPLADGLNVSVGIRGHAVYVTTNSSKSDAMAKERLQVASRTLNREHATSTAQSRPSGPDRWFVRVAHVGASSVTYVHDRPSPVTGAPTV